MTPVSTAEVVAAQVIVAVAREHLHHVAFELDRRDIEGARPPAVEAVIGERPVLSTANRRFGRRLAVDATGLTTAPRQ